MRTLSEPIERVLDSVRLFLGMPEVRAMHVSTSTQLLPGIVGAVAACEDKVHNTSPMFLLLTPSTRSSRGWDGRDLELRSEHEDLREAMTEADLAIAPLPVASGRDGVTSFALTLASSLRSLQSPLEGLIIILVPGAGAAALGDDLHALWAQTALRGVRWIILESATELRGTVQALGVAGLLVEAVPSEASLAAELKQRAENAAAAPPGTTGPAAAGCAGPGVRAPRRPHEGPETSQELLQQVAASQGISAAHADPRIMKDIRVAVLRAMAASASRDLRTAVDQFRIARDLCIGAGLAREAVTYEMTMASVAVATAPRAACDAFTTARKRALEIGDAALATRAELGRAGALVAMRSYPEAIDAYRSTGELAGTGEPLLAIEAFRMCGQLLAGARRDQEAATVWRRALDLAEHAEPTARIGSTAPETALALADLCDRHGLAAQATSLRTQASLLEAPTDVHSVDPRALLQIPAAQGAE